MLVVTDQTAAELHAEGGGKPAQPPGVLGRHHVRLAEHADQPRRCVLRITDRRPREDQPAAGLISPVRVTVPLSVMPRSCRAYDGAVSDAVLPARHLLREGSGRPEAPVATLGVRARLRGTIATDRFWGWMGPLLVTAIGGFLRFWHLDRRTSSCSTRPTTSSRATRT